MQRAKSPAEMFTQLRGRPQLAIEILLLTCCAGGVLKLTLNTRVVGAATEQVATCRLGKVSASW
jgi:hypothetical protein